LNYHLNQAGRYILAGFFFIAFVIPSPGQEDAEKNPELNSKILGYVDSQMNKKVDRGECWDLMKQALDHAGADWEFPNTWGKKFDPFKESTLPGDCIQYTNAVFKYRKGNVEYTSKAPKHSAIIYEVLSPTQFVIAQQNANGVRKVKLGELDLSTLKRGKIEFYRPLE
jgi:hypothetical protein